MILMIANCYKEKQREMNEKITMRNNLNLGKQQRFKRERTLTSSLFVTFDFDKKSIIQISKHAYKHCWFVSNRKISGVNDSGMKKEFSLSRLDCCMLFVGLGLVSAYARRHSINKKSAEIQQDVEVLKWYCAFANRKVLLFCYVFRCKNETVHNKMKMYGISIL